MSLKLSRELAGIANLREREAVSWLQIKRFCINSFLNPLKFQTEIEKCLDDKDQNFHLNNGQVIVLSLFLSLIAFIIDLSLRWAVGGLFYIIVILLSLHSSNKKYPYIFAGVSTFLIILSLIIIPPVGQFYRVLANRILDTVIIWLLPIWFLHYKGKREADSKLASIVNSSEDAIWSIDLNWKILGCNKSSQKILDYAQEEMVGCTFENLIPETERPMFARIFEHIKAGEGVRRLETVQRKKGGELINVAVSVSPIKDICGNAIACSIIARDISEAKEAEKKEIELMRKLQLEKLKLEQVLSLEEGMHKSFELNQLVDFVIEKITYILNSKKCSLMLIDENTKELCIRGYAGLDDSVILNSKMKIGDPIAGIIALEGHAVLVEDIEKDDRFLRRNRPTYRSKSFICAPIKVREHVIGVISVSDKNFENDDKYNELDLKVLCMIARQVANAIEASKIYRDLVMLTITDPLTGLFNFRYLGRTLDQEIYRAKRYDRHLCILMIDVDDFKKYNDTYGHVEGDNLLKELAQVFNDNIRNSDVACRYAGDEFVIILPDTEINEAEVVAKKVKMKAETLNLKSKVSLSIGVAHLPTGKDINRYEFIAKVDAALYRAKKEGKSRISSS